MSDLADNAASRLCRACGGRLRPSYTLSTPILHCADCGLFSLDESRTPLGFDSPLDEAMRVRAIRGLRESNFRVIVKSLAEILGPGLRGLDVGSAYGWFIAIALENGFECIGIEPERSIADQANSAGLRTIVGFFPQDVPGDCGKFDFVIFNDVYEHIRDVNGALSACRAMLRPSGMVILNLPMSTGAVYRVAELAYRFGRWRGPLERLYQLQFHSPHQHYFRAEPIARLAANNGFAVVRSVTLRSIDYDTLGERVLMDGSMTRSRYLYMAIAKAMGMLRPLLVRLPSDTKCFYLRLVQVGDDGSSAAR